MFVVVNNSDLFKRLEFFIFNPKGIEGE